MWSIELKHWENIGKPWANLRYWFSFVETGNTTQIYYCKALQKELTDKELMDREIIGKPSLFVVLLSSAHA